MAKTKKSTEFEKLAAQIFEELSPHAQVKWNDFIYGHDTGIERQIDVSIRANLEGHEILTIVQAKDWNKRADINTVGEFASVIKDVRATKGILVCRSGFAKTTKKYAQNLGIELINIHDAQSKDWNLEMKIPIVWIEEEPHGNIEMQYTFDYAHDLPLNQNRLPILSDDEGATTVDIWLTLKNWWNNGFLSRLPSVVHTKEFPKSICLLVLNDNQPTWIPIEVAKIVYKVTRNVWLGHFKPEDCRGVFDYLNDTFTASHLPIGQIPPKPQGDWYLIENPEHLVIRTKSPPVITRNWILDFETDSISLDDNEIPID